MSLCVVVCVVYFVYKLMSFVCAVLCAVVWFGCFVCVVHELCLCLLWLCVLCVF